VLTIKYAIGASFYGTAMAAKRIGVRHQGFWEVMEAGSFGGLELSLGAAPPEQICIND
jgi:hypothetical protein